MKLNEIKHLTKCKHRQIVSFNNSNCFHLSFEQIHQCDCASV